MIMFSCINPGEKSKQEAAAQETNKRKSFHSFLTSFSLTAYPWKPIEYSKYCINYTFGWDFAEGGQALSTGTWGTSCTSDTEIPFFFTIGSAPETSFILVPSEATHDLAVSQCHLSSEISKLFQFLKAMKRSTLLRFCSLQKSNGSFSMDPSKREKIPNQTR